MIAAIAGILIACWWICRNGAPDSFRADRAWLYAPRIVASAYMVSRGLAKSGSHDFDGDRGNRSDQNVVGTEPASAFFCGRRGPAHGGPLSSRTSAPCCRRCSLALQVGRGQVRAAAYGARTLSEAGARAGVARTALNAAWIRE